MEWVERFRRSGQTQSAFAQAHGLRVDQLRYWIYHCDGASSPAPTMPAFQEFQLEGGLSQRQWSAELSLPNGATLRMGSGLAKELIGTLFPKHA